MRDFISSWTHGPDWKTWVAHSVLALVLFALSAPWLGLKAGAAVPAGYYSVRELEQLLYGWVGRDLDKDWRDHILDVVCPVAAVVAAALLVGAL